MQQVSAEPVANYFIGRGLAAEQAGDLNDVTPLKLQKLLYFAHGWHLALKDAPLFPEPVEAWAHGPVIGSLYREFSDYEGNPIARPLVRLEFTDNDIVDIVPEVEDPSGWTKQMLDRIWELYGHFDGGELSGMTHEEGTPWKRVRDHFGLRWGQRAGVTIPNDLIRDYFLSRKALPALG